jgi:hypothetical protein
MPFLGRIRVSITNYFRSVCLAKNDIDSFEGVLNFVQFVSDTYGVSALKFVQELAFGDNDLNLSGLISMIVRLILHKCDKTEVNLNETSTIKANKAIKAASAGLKRQQRPGLPPSLLGFLSEFEPTILEDYLVFYLQFLTNIMKSDCFCYL